MVVLFYAENGNRVKTSSKTVEGNGPEALSSGASDEETEEEPEFGYLKVSENMEAGKKYYFAVCASSMSSSGGFGLLEIMAILIGIAAVTSGGLLAFLWVRYNKKQKNGK